MPMSFITKFLCILFLNTCTSRSLQIVDFFNNTEEYEEIEDDKSAGTMPV